ncbi:lysoplasmalogenase [Aestuariimicrobium ganziense]|uniref:lysoplasmalogenase n=1 Tax=Aestuariimicrobium ganziense TaxID=2773677 RepID=UPI001943C1BE|nr:lysoplasmalogenase [Aestuariimicrobium ganziense]
MRRPSAPALIGCLAFVVASIIHLGMLVAGAEGSTARVSQGSLMLTLAIWALAPLPQGRGLAPRPFPAWFALGMAAAIGFSWLGDVGPAFAPDGTGFLTMVGFFFLAQVAWIATLFPWRRHSILTGSRRPLVLVYLVAAGTVLALTASGAGSLVWAVVPYAVVLAATGVLATGLGWRGTLGGLLFIVSDALIAIYTFRPSTDPGEPTRALVIMATYCLAQGLLVWGVRLALQVGRR